MNETEPLYFKEFRKHIDEKFDAVDKKFDAVDKKFDAIDQKFGAIDKKFETHIPKYFIEFKEDMNSRFDSIEEKLDMHFEEIGDIKIEVTKTNMLLRKKADISDVRDIEHRTKKLENAVFV